MNSFVKKFVSALAISASFAFASVDAEMEGMDVVSRDDGTFLIASPTFSRVSNCPNSQRHMS